MEHLPSLALYSLQHRGCCVPRHCPWLSRSDSSAPPTLKCFLIRYSSFVRRWQKQQACWLEALQRAAYLFCPWFADLLAWIFIAQQLRQHQSVNLQCYASVNLFSQLKPSPQVIGNKWKPSRKFAFPRNCRIPVLLLLSDTQGQNTDGCTPPQTMRCSTALFQMAFIFESQAGPLDTLMWPSAKFNLSLLFHY